MKIFFINDSTTDSNWGGRAATVALGLLLEEAGSSITRVLTIDQLFASALEPDSADLVQGTRGSERQESRARNAVRGLVPPAVLDARRRLRHRGRRHGETTPIPGAWSDYDGCLRTVVGERTPWPTLLKWFEETDVALVFGDGDIYGNGVLPRTMLFLSYILKTRYRKPVVMTAHSADLDDPALLEVAEHVYPLFDDVVFRDPISRDRCSRLCHGRFAADPAFWFEPASRDLWSRLAARPTYFDVWPDTSTFDPSTPYVCVGGSSMLDSMSQSSAVDGFLSVFGHIRSVYKGQIVLTASAEVDEPVLRVVARQCGLPLVGVTTPVQQAVDVIGNADAYIGGRFHPAVFALRGGTPVVPLSSKTFKMRALAEMAGLEASTYDVASLSAASPAIGARLAALLAEGNVLRSRLRAWGATMAESCRGNVAFLKSFPSD